MKLLITGSRGFLGKSLAHYAVKNGHHVLAVARSDSGGLMAGMEFVRCALDHAGFVDILNRFAPDVVVHAAGSASVGYSFQQPREDFLMAVETWGAVLDAVRKSKGHPLVIFPSSASVYGNPTRLPVSEGAALRPISPYGFHKVMCEQLAQEYAHCFGLNVVSARLFSTIGPYQRRLLVWELFRQAIEDNSYLTIQGTGVETRDFLYVDDICRYFLGIAEREPKGFWAVNVGSGESTSVRRMAELVTHLVGSTQAIVTLNKELPGDPKHWQADTALLRELVPYQAAEIVNGLGECVRHWLADASLSTEQDIRCSVEGHS
jgi:UDP-glucose 4-epimerase